MLRRGLQGDDLIQEIEDKVQQKELRKFSSMPSYKLLRNYEIAHVEVSGTHNIIIRVGNKLLKTGDLTEV